MDYYRSLNVATLDADVPTVFELFAARQLTDLIGPYIRYILVHYAQSHPQYLLRIVGKFDELFAAGFGLVEYLYLRKWNASFVEKFYGLKRVNRLPVTLVRTQGPEVDRLRRLTKRQVLWSVLLAVGVPYLKEKAQVRYERLVSRYTFRDIAEDRPADDAPLLAHWRYQADCALLKWFPRCCFASNSLELLLCMRYLFKGTGPFTIADCVLNTRYSRLSEHDIADNAPPTLNVFALALRGLGYVLPTTLFAIKFLEWWNTSQLASRLSFIGPDLPPPDTLETQSSTEATGNAVDENQNPEKQENQYPKQLLGNECPLCHKDELETPAVLETGVVFCYKCIVDYLQSLDPSGEPRCPVTGIELLLTEWNKGQNQWDIGGVRRLMV